MPQAKEGVKIVIIGGGSYGWTPTLFTDFALNRHLRGSHVVLQDIDPETLAVMVPLCRKISEATGSGLEVEGQTELDKALPGADFVGLTISTGTEVGTDHSTPLRHGIRQTVGDTVGPGGWIRALRNIPVVVDIGRRVEALAPRAWFMNYSNPMTVLTRVLGKTSAVRSFGICHELQGFMLHAAYYLGVDWQKDIVVHAAGINHLSWVTQFSVLGREGLPLLREYARDPKGFRPPGDKGMDEVLRHSGGAAPSQRIKFDMLERFGTLPVAGDAHIAEFFSHYLSDEESAARWGLAGRVHTFARTTRRSDRRGVCEELLSGRRPLYLEHSHEHADHTIAALSGLGEPLVTPLNLPNSGQVDNLPRGAVVETNALVDASGPSPLAAGALPETLAADLHRHVANQEMIAEAGLSGDRELAVLALAGDPLVPDPDTARRIADDFFAEYRQWLPQFDGRWHP